jgi:hypothetical protein
MLAAVALFQPSLNAAPAERSGGADSTTSVEANRSVPPATDSLTTPTDVNTYGTSVESHITIGWPEFKVVSSGVDMLEDGTGSAYMAGGGSGPRAAAPVNLPQGAAITGIDLYYYDTNQAEELQVSLLRLPFTGGFVLLDGTNSTGWTGFGSASTNLASPVTVDSNSGLYAVYLFYAAAPTATLKWRAVRVRYKLQVSPAPAVASFTDVPTNHWAFKYVEALMASGITAGCGGSNFCPDSPLTRAQMAVFLSSALGLQFN